MTPLHVQQVLKQGLLGSVFLFVLARIYYLLAHPKKSIYGKLVLITGAGGGLGRFLALEFAKEGCNLVLVDINGNGIAAVKKEVQAAHPSCAVSCYEADLTDNKAVYALAGRVKSQCGSVWCLVNNAGIVTGTPFMETDDARIVKTFEVNTFAHFWTCKAFLQDMLDANDGHLVSIASVASFFAAPQMVDYAASKFAARGFAEGLRMELRKMGKDGITSTCICPGHIKTDMFKGFSMAGVLGDGLVPSLEPAYVAQMTVYAVTHGREVMLLPGISYVGAALKNIIPTRWMDTVNELMGISSAMSNFDMAHTNKKMGELGASPTLAPAPAGPAVPPMGT